MTTATQLLKAPRVGVKEFKTHLSEKIKSHNTMILMDHGQPKKVVIDYDEMVELLELIEELQDRELMKHVREGRISIQKGDKDVDAISSLERIRSKRKR